MLKIFLMVVTLFSLLAWPQVSLAAPSDPLGLSRLSIYTETSLITIILNIIRWFLGFLMLIAVVMIIYGGFLWLTSRGNQEQIDKAKRVLKNTAIGLILILASLMIVSFIVGWFTGGWQSAPTIPPPPGECPGCQYLGGGIIQSHYPARDQREVPRNTLIVVTFKEEMEVDSIIDCGASSCQLNDGLYSGDLNTGTDTNKVTIKDNGVQLNSSDVVVKSLDKKTFIFDPKNYLGIENQEITEEVTLGSGINRADGQAAFPDNGSYSWVFYTNGKLDLTPPQILEIIPIPDDNADGSGTLQLPLAAQGVITVSGQPTAKLAGQAELKYRWPNIQEESSANDFAPVLQVLVDGGKYVGTFGGNICIKFPDNNSKAEVDWGHYCNKTTDTDNSNAEEVNSLDKLGAQAVKVETDNSGDYIALGAGLRLFRVKTEPPFITGQIFRIDLQAPVTADTLTVGSKTFSFVPSGTTAGASEIALGSSINLTTSQIAYKLTSDQLLSSILSIDRTINTITLTSLALGSGGNNISFSTTASSNELSLNTASGHLIDGQNQTIIPTIVDSLDQPRNRVIQITFNEAINPLSISKDYLKIKDFGTEANPKTSGEDIAGTYTISNQYRTVEFVTDVPCGTNACGQIVYCLPGDAKIGVAAQAASLSTCTSTSCPGGYQCLDYPTSNLRCFGTPALCSTFNNQADCQRVSDSFSYNPTCSWNGLECEAEGGPRACADVQASDSGSAVQNCQLNGCTGRGSQVCQKDNQPYPQADSNFNGVLDMANNSLDGNKNTYAQGPQSQSGLVAYNLNVVAPYAAIPSTANMGDDVQWSFWTTDQIDLVSPKIVKGFCVVNVNDFNETTNGVCSSGAYKQFSRPLYDDGSGQVMGKSENILTTFSKLMRFGTFRPGSGYTLPEGQKVCQSGTKQGTTCSSNSDCNVALQTGVECSNKDPYSYFTLTPVNASAVGYWLTGVNLDVDQNTTPDASQSSILHTNFRLSSSYNLAVGSGVQDLAQNCYSPCAGPGCTVGDPDEYGRGTKWSNNQLSEPPYPYCKLPLTAGAVLINPPDYIPPPNPPPVNLVPDEINLGLPETNPEP